MTEQEIKSLIIKAMNKAFDIYRERHDLKYHEEDTIVDCFFDRAKIASFQCRYPGHILCPVKLKEGTGYVFFIARGLYLEYYICWEEDWSRGYTIDTLLKDESIETISDVKNFVHKTINKLLY